MQREASRRLVHRGAMSCTPEFSRTITLLRPHGRAAPGRQPVRAVASRQRTCALVASRRQWRIRLM
eukprot:1781108-Pyramimonas_sp.AAC.1